MKRINHPVTKPRRAISNHGKLTEEIGVKLKIDGYEIFFDQEKGSSITGKIVSHLGKTNERSIQLSQLDLAIIEKTSNRTMALVQVEETNERPKTLLGDIFGVLLGEKITFQKKELELGDWTTLLILGYRKAKQGGKGEVLEEKQDWRIQSMIKKADEVKSALKTGNSRIGRIMIKTFSDTDELEGIIRSVVSQG